MSFGLRSKYDAVYTKSYLFSGKRFHIYTHTHKQTNKQTLYKIGHWKQTARKNIRQSKTFSVNYPASTGLQTVTQRKVP
jgi:hypothetical protein